MLYGLPLQVDTKTPSVGYNNPSDGVSVCLEAEELSYFRDCEEGDVQ